MGISSIGNRLEETFLSSRKRILSSVFGIILLLSVPITLSLVYQQQDIRQRAAGSDYISGNCKAGDISCDPSAPGYLGPPESDIKDGGGNASTTCGGQGQACCSNDGFYGWGATCTCNDGKSPIDGICPSAPTPTPTPTPILLTNPVETPIPLVCDTDTNREDKCNCSNDSECASGYCNVQTTDVDSDEDLFGYCDIKPVRTCSSCLAAGISYLCSTAQGTSADTSYCSAIDRTNEGDTCQLCTPPSVTPSIPAGTTIAFSFSLPGIGSDSAKGLNNQPKHASQTIMLDLISPQGNNFQTFTEGVYNPATSLYNVNEAKNINIDGPYIIKVATINSLKKRSDGSYGIVQGKIQGSVIPVTTGDLNADNQMTLLDYNIMIDCFNKPYDDPVCKRQDYASKTYNGADLNDDGEIDLKDLNILLRAFANRQGD